MEESSLILSSRSCIIEGKKVIKKMKLEISQHKTGLGMTQVLGFTTIFNIKRYE